MLSLLILATISLSGCSPQVAAPSNIKNSRFPSVQGTSLKAEKVAIPEHYEGKNTLLLVGYVQRAQFDIDRWILGLLQLETKVKFVEVPTIAGMMPEMVQGFINNGMRKGIPESDWKSVVTIFGDAEKIVATLGNERPTNAYVVLLDSKGAIIKVFNNGYSASNVKELHDLISGLEVAKCSSGLN